MRGFFYLPPGVPLLVDGEVFIPPIEFPAVPCLNASLLFGPGDPPVPLTYLLEVPAEDPVVPAPLAVLPLLPPLLAPVLPPLPPAPPLCASASVELNARMEATAIVVSFMVVSLS